MELAASVATRSEQGTHNGIDQIVSGWRKLVDRSVLTRGEDFAHSFASATPFPHIVLDDLFDRDFLEAVNREFDQLGPRAWELYENREEYKRGTRPGRALPPTAQTYFDIVYSSDFVRWVTAVTGISQLIGDPWLFGGGMHQMPKNGHFSVHIDFQNHPYNHLDTRLVLITYLNRDWREEFGGMLELWTPDGSRCGERVLPTLGRTVLFLQTPQSPHGVTPNVAPHGRERRSVASYYYTNGIGEARQVNSTTTKFIRSGDSPLTQDTKWWVKRAMPPIVLDTLRELKGRAPAWKHAPRTKPPGSEKP